MSAEEFSLFGDEPVSPTPAPKRHVTKPEPKPRQPTKKELRERAPAPRNRAPKKIEPEPDNELDEVVRIFAAYDMLAPEELEKYSDAVEPVISKESRDNMRSWRERNTNGNDPS